MTKEQERALAQEVAQYEKENSNGLGDFEEVPAGNYEISVESMEIGKSKKGDDMFKARFKVLAGKYKGNSIFMNQILNEAFQINIVNNLLRSLGYEHDDIEFKSIKQYREQTKGIMEDIKDDSFELDYSFNSKGFGRYKIDLID